MKNQLYVAKWNCGYELWVKKPSSLDPSTGWHDYDNYDVGFLIDFCTREFHRYTNIRLRNGQIKKIKSIKITLGD